MGAPVWGEKYIDRMVRYTLASLGSPRNLEALAGKAVLVFYGLAHERDGLWQATRWLRQSGIHTLFRNLPPEITQMAWSQDKYGVLSVVQNLLAHEAGHTGRGLHMFMPDHLYCDGYFENLAKLGAKHAAIIQQGMSANIDAAADDLEAYRDPATNALVMKPEEVGGLALKHLHPRTARTVMNGLEFGKQWPTSHQVTWVGKDAVHMACAPQNIAWLCPELCLDAPIAFSSTMDMLPPEYIPIGAEYAAQPEDGLAFCELSDSKNVAPIGYTDEAEFAVRHWQQCAFTTDYMGYFAKRSLTPIPHNPDGMSDEAIEAQHVAIGRRLDERKVWAMEAFFRSQCPLRWPE